MTENEISEIAICSAIQQEITLQSWFLTAEIAKEARRAAEILSENQETLTLRFSAVNLCGALRLNFIFRSF